MEAPIVFRGLDHWFGHGAVRRQVLFEIELEIGRGEIVILTGPSGSGKTTALTLAGALRSAQNGSLRVLGNELLEASKRQLVEVRRNIGYIFQLHNLLDSLTAVRNVEMALALRPEVSRSEARRRSLEMLEAVGLGERADHHADELSGGQRQRVAIARALVARPQIVLADEPTASLDKESGRAVVGQLERLAREQGTTVLLVTHDNRILDVADRIVHLEDGRIGSLQEAVARQSQQMMGLLAGTQRRGELARRIGNLDDAAFTAALAEVTGEAADFLRVTDLARSEAFESMLDQLLEVCTRKIGDLLGAERASLFLHDTESGELWSKVARDGGGRPFEIRIADDAGIAGAVATTGEIVNLEDAYADPRFQQDVDRRSGFHTRSLLCVPLRDRSERIFGVAQLLNKRGGKAFGDEDVARFRTFMDSVGLLLESWWIMSSRGSVAGPPLPADDERPS